MIKSKRIFWNIAMTWGLYVALISVSFTTVLYVTDNLFISFRSWIDTVIFIVGIVFCARAFKSNTPPDEPFAYSRALGIGVATSFFASIILGLFYFVLYRYINPSLIDEMQLMQEEVLIESGFSDQIIEQQIAMKSIFFNPGFMAFQHMFTTVFTGLLISLITSVFTRVKTSDGFDEAMREIDE